MTVARMRSGGSRAASDAHFLGVVGAAGGYSSPADCSGGAGSFGGDYGAGV